MPLQPRVKVDASGAIATFDPNRGISVNIRNRLRPTIIDLTRRLGARVDSNLSAGLKTRRSLYVKKEMVEDAKGVIGRVTTLSTKNPMLPIWLEEGTKPHPIVARNARALYFFWDKVGANVFFKRVMHPGFAGIHYTQNAFSDMQSEIKSAIRKAVSDGLGTRR